MMELHYSDASPFARKCRVVIAGTGQTDDVRLRAVSQTPVAPDAGLADQNPLGKVPALSRDEGPTLYDSRVICRYLDHRAGAGLYPEGRIWDVLTLEATADGILDAAVLMVYEARTRPEEKRHDPWVEAQWRKVSQALNALDNRWVSHLHGPRHVGQIAVGCALGYLDLRHGARDWRAGRSDLARWFENFAALPEMTSTAPART